MSPLGRNSWSQIPVQVSNSPYRSADCSDHVDVYKELMSKDEADFDTAVGWTPGSRTPNANVPLTPLGVEAFVTTFELRVPILVCLERG